MAEIPFRATQKEVARLAKVHQSTVSMALRNHPAIPEKTRRHVLSIANKLGYAPDPMLSGLIAHRNRMRPVSFHGTLAWVAYTTPDFDWRTSPHFTRYFTGAEKQARLLGYQIEVFDFGTPGLSRKRLASIFRARNIRGLLVCPMPRPQMKLEFAWEDFSVITFGHTLADPQFHTVTTGYFRNLVAIMQQLHARGYQRIAFAVEHVHDQRLDHNCLAGYAVELLLHNRPLVPELFRSVPQSPAEFKAWYRRNRPDAMIVHRFDAVEFLAQAGLKVPSDMGVVLPVLTSDQSPISGMIEDGRRMGEVAVTLLADMLQRGERGVPHQVLRTLVDGYWHEGTSLRPLTAPIRTEVLA